MTAVKVEVVGNKIWVDTGGYSERKLRACKAVRGAQWNKGKRVWMYPLDWSVCTDIRKNMTLINEDLDIGPELTKWAWVEKERRDHVPSVKSLEKVALPRVEKEAPILWTAMQNRPFQTVGAAFGAHNRHCLIADDPGLGKTLQAIAAAIEADLRGLILVVAPKTAGLVTWPAELRQWVPGDRVVELAGLSGIKPSERPAYVKSQLGKPSTFGSHSKRTWVITSPYWVSMKAELDSKGNYVLKDGQKQIVYKLPELFDVEWQGIIVDESHGMLIANTANKKKHTQTRLGMGTLPVAQDGIKMAMSGTPTRGKNQNFWGTLNWLRPDLYSSYWKWVDRWFDVYDDGSGYGGQEMGGIKNPDGFYAELSEIMVRRTKGEVAADLPAKIYGGTYLDPKDMNSPVGIWLPMDGKQNTAYQSMVNNGATELDGGSVIANGILSEWTRLKQFSGAHAKMNGDNIIPDVTCSNKFDWVVEFLDDRGISAKAFGDSKVVIASQFAKLVNAYADQLESMGIPCHTLTGATKPADRVKVQAEWQAKGGPRVFLLSTKAGGVSLTLDAADDVIILDETWIPDDQLQVEDRTHRISRPDHQVSIWYVRSLDSIEEAIAAVTGGREAEMRKVMDATRGVDIRKKIMEYTRKKAA